jgi:hypothetical protein
VAKDRLISVEDGQIRQGRKPRSVLFDRRHMLGDLDTGQVPALKITPAKVPEAAIITHITTDLDATGATFPKAICAACSLRAGCTTSSHGRSLAIHFDEALLSELREYQATPAGRARLREHVKVEHALAHVDH